MGQSERLKIFGHAADVFFSGADWLVPATGVPALTLKVAVALTQLIIQQADARWQAVMDQPIGILPTGYSVPGPDEIFDWFEFEPDPPEVQVQFAPEIEAGDWEALQKAHGILHEVIFLNRPLLQTIFANEILGSDYRAIVNGYDAAKVQADQVRADPKMRSALQYFVNLLTGDGPEQSDAEAQAALEAQWSTIVGILRETVT